VIASADGQSGTVSIVAHGTTSVSGWTHGSFNVEGVGPTAPATTTGLATLAGDGHGSEVRAAPYNWSNI